ncbi:MAG: hypothetical protein IPJ27_15230 [Candidatus Accumulibacter sp.]|uniref:Uncharacterized protein n=1 Tax=Candidatus Accumulibacter proximus TaxID=2954385 RepID=A0A935PZ32_9PROT|nr:hypothetical protein [Candidatus Accumulibacter proximus]
MPVTIDRTLSFIIVRRTALPSAATTRKPLQRGIAQVFHQSHQVLIDLAEHQRTIL